MRIVHILEATSGGTRRHVLDLLPALQKRGLQCTLLYSALRNPAFRQDAAELERAGIATEEIPMGHRWARQGDGQALRAIHRHLQANDYDVIHCHSSNAGLLGRFANTGKKQRPLVYTPHYIAFAAGIPRLQRRAALYLEKLLAPRTAQFIAVSNHERDLIQRVLKTKGTSTIYNGVENIAPRHPSPIPHPSSLTIGCFGRLTPQKNQALLLRALPAVLTKVPQVKLLLAGGGEDEVALRKLARQLKIEDHVDFRGELHEARGLYSSCGLIAHPSRWEGCSYALLEAMASSRAVIASNTGGNPEVLDGAGLLLPPGDVSMWAQEIIALAQDSARREQMGRTAKERVAQSFTLSTMVDATIAIYQHSLS